MAYTLSLGRDRKKILTDDRLDGGVGVRLVSERLTARTEPGKRLDECACRSSNCHGPNESEKASLLSSTRLKDAFANLVIHQELSCSILRGGKSHDGLRAARLEADASAAASS